MGQLKVIHDVIIHRENHCYVLSRQTRFGWNESPSSVEYAAVVGPADLESTASDEIYDLTLLQHEGASQCMQESFSHKST
eukprot:scaffold28386_cov94-Skeletonema_dohrnii-CCMP3373.AAC.1